MLRAITDLIHARLLGLPAANLFILGAGGASQMALVVKNSPANARDGRVGSISGLGRSPGGRHGNPLQYSCLENRRGQRSLAGYGAWGHKGWDTAEAAEHTGVGVLSLGGWARVGRSHFCGASGNVALLARTLPRLHCLSPASLGRGRRRRQGFFLLYQAEKPAFPSLAPCPQPTHPCGHLGSFLSRQSYLGIGCPQ